VSETTSRDAVIQFEYDRKRVAGMSARHVNGSDGNFERTISVAVPRVCLEIARAALADVFNNGGTLVVVVGEAKVTIVQRTGAEDISTQEPRA
jgi:hypothetical protein